MLSCPIRRFDLTGLIFLNIFYSQRDKADLFERFENQADEEVLSRVQELQTFKSKFTQQKTVDALVVPNEDVAREIFFLKTL